MINASNISRSKDNFGDCIDRLDKKKRLVIKPKKK